MALTPTRQIPLGFIAPEFDLINPKENNPSNLKDAWLLNKFSSTIYSSITFL